MNYWLMKSEPDTYSIDDLKRAVVDFWDGVRNYQVRNMLRDQVQPGDLAFFYHSNCKPPAIVGIMRIQSAGYPDDTALNPDDPHYDPKSTPDNPRWYGVDVGFERKLARPITLAELKSDPALTDLALVKRGNRLSVMPLTERQWKHILSLEK